MAADKRHPENDPHDEDLIDDLTERVFKNYEPPRRENSETNDEEAEESQPAAVSSPKSPPPEYLHLSLPAATLLLSENP